MIPLRLVIAAAALGTAPALAQKPAETPPPPALDAASERAALDFALARGRLLFALDRAAWVGTDDFIARVRNYRSLGLRGFIVERDGDGFAVTFYGGPDGSPVAFYRGIVREHRVRSRQVFPPAARPALTTAQRRLAAAREAASAAAQGRPCGDSPFNTAVVPPETPDGPIDVYLMTPQTQQGSFPVGGHYRLTVGSDGRAGRERAFTNSCLLMSRQGAPRGGSVAAMVVTHLLDPVPTEIHVFTALAARLPVYVGIVEPRQMYVVTGDAIRRVD